MNMEQTVKHWMLDQLASGEYIDPLTDEVMLTQLAEAAAWEFELDLDDELPFELAYATAQRWEGMQAAASRGAANPTPHPPRRALRPPSAVQ